MEWHHKIFDVIRSFVHSALHLGEATPSLLVDIINKSTPRDVIVMIFVRRLVLACLKFNILFRARHVAGVKNILADSLSQLQVS